MKTKNVIITLSAAAALTIGILVACSKDATQTTTDNPVVPAAKSATLTQYMFQIWAKSDSAYRNNRTTFQNVCKNNDYSGFLEITNITDSVFYEFEKEADIASFAALGPLGTTWGINECIPCSEGGLPAFGQNVAQLRQVLDTLIVLNSPDTLPDFMPYMDSCLVLCKIIRQLNGRDLDWCLFNCNMRRAIRDSQQNYMAITMKPWQEL